MRTTRLLLTILVALFLANFAQAQESHHVNKIPHCSAVTAAMDTCIGGKEAGRMAWVNDGLTAHDCSVGGGSFSHLCMQLLDETRLAVPQFSSSGALTADSIVAQVLVVSLAPGELTENTVHLVTAAGEYDIPTTFCSATSDIGNWITVVLEDPTVLVEITLDDASNKFWVAGLSIDVAHELHTVSSGSLPGDHVTLVCMVIDAIYSTSMSYQADGSIGWADGGA